MTYPILKLVAMLLSALLNAIIASEEWMKPADQRRAWRPWLFGATALLLAGAAIKQAVDLAS